MKEPSNEQQKEFFNLLMTFDGDVAKAAEEAGYAREYGYVLVRNHRPYITELVRDKLALHGPRAAHVLVDGMEDDGKFVNGKERRGAAIEVLDRIGVGKNTSVDMNVEAKVSGVILLPAKDKDEYLSDAEN